MVLVARDRNRAASTASAIDTLAALGLLHKAQEDMAHRQEFIFGHLAGEGKASGEICVSFPKHSAHPVWSLREHERVYGPVGRCWCQPLSTLLPNFRVVGHRPSSLLIHPRERSHLDVYNPAFAPSLGTAHGVRVDEAVFGS